ncbi:cell division regulator GpsB [Aureibacillus halotolerans]|uniref:Cell cycle protein GpsB n=1 Tax=Aureibacillus halotolerans TaxID=1508390 RepID=A0A4R6U6T6_9BACI|nr:cell division regulator GpsB [Aureibacillus halotolerans]TDQ41476.1 DivIVA domain-containing protein [Aureibacillus halotolerans]
MLSDKMVLSAKDILEKDFKTGIKGYNQDEVDQFLDQVIKDYETMHAHIEALEQENQRLKKQSTEAPKQQRQAQPTQQGSTNYDILKRLSNLERHVFGSKLYE